MVHDALAELELAVLLVLEEVALLLGVLVQPEVGAICIDKHVIITLGELALWRCTRKQKQQQSSDRWMRRRVTKEAYIS